MQILWLRAARMQAHVLHFAGDTGGLCGLCAAVGDSMVMIGRSLRVAGPPRWTGRDLLAALGRLTAPGLSTSRVNAWALPISSAGAPWPAGGHASGCRPVTGQRCPTQHRRAVGAASSSEARFLPLAVLATSPATVAATSGRTTFDARRRMTPTRSARVG